MAESEALPTRTEFFCRWRSAHVLLTWLDSERLETECRICYEDMQDTETSPNGNRHPIVLSCAHHFCKDCIRRWTLNRNTCPWCRKVLFQQDSPLGFDCRTIPISTDDATNLRELRILLEETRSDHNFRLSSVPNSAFASIVQARSLNFGNGTYSADVENYAPYLSPASNQYIDQAGAREHRRLVIGKDLRALVEGAYFRFLEGDLRAPKPSIASHPLAMLVCTNMILTVIRHLNGTILSAADLSTSFAMNVFSSPLNRHAVNLKRNGQLPGGYGLFCSDLRERVVRLFARL